jgi:hypothetical protein
MVVIDDRAWFVSTCSCGWRSSPLAPNRVYIAWEDHVDEAQRRRRE